MKRTKRLTKNKHKSRQHKSKNRIKKRGGRIRMFGTRRHESIKEENVHETRVMNPNTTIGKLYYMYKPNTDEFSITTCHFLKFLDELKNIMDSKLFESVEIQLDIVFKNTKHFEDFKMNLDILNKLFEQCVIDLKRQAIQLEQNYSNFNEYQKEYEKKFGKFDSPSTISLTYYDYYSFLLSRFHLRNT
jgi:exonuclease III